MQTPAFASCTVLVAVGEGGFHFELLNDRSTGHLTLWVLDAAAENFVRGTNKSFTLPFSVDGKETPIQAKTTANPATGERAGATSQLDGQADFLKTAAGLAGRLPGGDIRGRGFTNIAFQLKP